MKKKPKELTEKAQRRSFVKLCESLVASVEKGELREEEAAYKIVEAGLFDGWPEGEAIFDAAADAKMPREMTYAQNMDHWDQKTADVLKQKEWKKVVDAVEKAKTFIEKYLKSFS